MWFEGLGGLQLQFAEPSAVGGPSGHGDAVESIEQCQQVSGSTGEVGDQSPGVIEPPLTGQREHTELSGRVPECDGPGIGRCAGHLGASSQHHLQQLIDSTVVGSSRLQAQAGQADHQGGLVGGPPEGWRGQLSYELIERGDGECDSFVAVRVSRVHPRRLCLETLTHQPPGGIAAGVRPGDFQPEYSSPVGVLLLVRECGQEPGGFGGRVVPRVAGPVLNQGLAVGFASSRGGLFPVDLSQAPGPQQVCRGGFRVSRLLVDDDSERH